MMTDERLSSIFTDQPREYAAATGFRTRSNHDSEFSLMLFRRHWMLVAQACAFNATPICTAYDSLGPDGLTHSLNETESQGMFTNAELLGTLYKVIDKCKTVKLVIFDGKPEEGIVEKLRAVREGLTVMGLDEVMQLGKQKPVEARKAKREDVYCCMYTSGSSESKLSCALFILIASAGTPKGVLLTHANVVSASA